MTSPGTSGVAAGLAHARVLVDLEADAVAERELEARRRDRRPGRCAACGGPRPRRRRAARRSSSRPVTPGRIASRTSKCASRTSASCGAVASSTSPTTKVRVMSAQQPVSSSRGQRSISIGRLAGSGPEPGSWPTPCQTEATMTSGGAGAPWAAHASRSAARTCSAVSGTPSMAIRVALGRRRRAGAAAAAAIPASRGALGAADAGELGARTSRGGAGRTSSWSSVSATPSARRRSATASGNSGRPPRRAAPSARPRGRSSPG